MNQTLRSIFKRKLGYFILFAAALGYYWHELDYTHLLTQRPSGIHQWRQSDGASLAMLFYQDGRPIWEPSIHNQLHGNGQAGGEFPITYYTASLLYHVFGPHESILRGLHLFIFMSGVFVLLSALMGLSAYRLFALFPLLWFLHSPTLLFYINNFLPDGPALGFALMGTGLMLSFFNTGKQHLIYLGGIAFSFSALIKISMLIPFIALWMMMFYYRFYVVSDLRFRFLQGVAWKHLLSSLAIVFVPAMCWYVYIAHYNDVHHGLYFTTRTYPIWKARPFAIVYTARSLYHHWMNIALPPYTQKIFLFALLALLIFMWKRNAFFALLALLCTGGCIAYILLFFTTFQHHDYYFLTLMFVPLFVYIYAVDLLSWQIKERTRGLIRWTAVALLTVLTWQSAEASVHKYRETYMGWFQDFTINPALDDLEPFLDTRGITYENKVICLPDESPNRSLYLMNRKGWTGLTGIYSTDDVDTLINRGAEYGVVIDTSFNTIHFFKHHVGDTIGYHENILVFKLKKSD